MNEWISTTSYIMWWVEVESTFWIWFSMKAFLSVYETLRNCYQDNHQPSHNFLAQVNKTTSVYGYGNLGSKWILFSKAVILVDICLKFDKALVENKKIWIYTNLLQCKIYVITHESMCYDKHWYLYSNIKWPKDYLIN